MGKWISSVNNVKQIMNLNHTQILLLKATQGIEIDQEVFQKYILSGCSFYKISVEESLCPFYAIFH